MEEHVIQKAYTMRNPAFPIFHLKNKFGWADKQEITNNVNITLSADERVARIAELQRKAQLRAGAIEAEIIEISTWLYGIMIDLSLRNYVQLPQPACSKGYSFS